MPKKKTPKKSAPSISLRGCTQHNLKNIDLDIPLGELTVVTGPSGSGKSSLAFHTLYAEGQRRYVETFSPYVRQFFDRMDKPAVDSIEGIPPAIAIEQKNHVRTTRSTVGTLTEINDYLKILFARLALGYDPKTGEKIRPDSSESAAQWATENLVGENVLITFPIAVPKDAKATEFLPFLSSQGYLRICVGHTIYRTDEPEDVLEKITSLPATVAVIQDRIRIESTETTRLLEALENAFRLGKGHAAITPFDNSSKLPARTFSTTWSNPTTGFTLRAPTPALFSFNSPLGACPECRGFGRVIGIDLNKAVPDHSLTLRQGAIKPFQGERGEKCQYDLLQCCAANGVDVDTPWEELDDDTREWIYYGDRDSFDSEADFESSYQMGEWYGVKGFFDWAETKSYKMHVRVFLSRYRSYTTCHTCRGKRLQPEALCFKIHGKTLPDIWQMPVSESLPFVENLLVEHRERLTTDSTLALVLKEIHSRLQYLHEVGLSYLTLDRATRTLSGGEIERVNLTTCLGASLTGTLFVLDEPTVGLHPRDIDRLVTVMQALRDKGNTLVVVEHEQTVMESADNLVDIGPGAGQHGGEILFSGKITDAEQNTGTIPWINGTRQIDIPKKRRKPSKAKLSIYGASCHNIAKLNATIPLGLFVCLTGVSGSGKSTLAYEIIYKNIAQKLGQQIDEEAAPIKSITGLEHIEAVELIDQSAVARTPRSTPAVFLGAFEPIRQLFTTTDQAKSAGLKPGFFSFNSGEGRCDRCAGNGFEKIEMQFLSDVYVTCPDCEGKRYKDSTLDFKYRGKSIHDVLEMTVAEAIEFYADHQDLPKAARSKHALICKVFEPLIEVGLGYLKLGQALNTLSGGESQRLKLCQLLINSYKSSNSKKLLILDEPTTGLHFTDIERLLAVFQSLVGRGFSLLVIEHNLDIIKSADWIIDLGPEAGNSGGRIVAKGSPETVAKTNTPTAKYIAKTLKPKAIIQVTEPHATSYQKQKITNSISLHGARHHNLKNISVEIPRDKMVIISGLSGSGKSTLAFDILFAEGQRRFLDSMSAYARQFADQLEKPELDQLQGLPPTVAIEQRVSQGGGKSTVATITEVWNFIRLLYSKLGVIYCPECQVPVEKQSVAAIEKKIRAEMKKGPIKILAPLIKGKKGYHTDIAAWAEKQGYEELLVDRQFKPSEGFTRLERFVEHDIDVVIAAITNKPSMLPASIARALEIGKGLIKIFTADKRFILLSTDSSCPSCDRSFEELDPRLFSFNSPHGWCPECRGHGKIPKRNFRIDHSRFDSVLEAEMDADRSLDRMDAEEFETCSSCNGSRLNPVGSSVQLNGTPISKLSTLSIDEAEQHFSKIKITHQRDKLIARDILPEISQRLKFLQEVGLGYLHLNRSGNTLSGGEAQRIRLAAQLGSNLRGVLYVLDEPTIGLHPRDNSSLLKTLTALRNQGNSLVIVEHDEDTIMQADHIIDLGPAAGRLGGEIVYQGRPPNPKKPVAKSSKLLKNSPTFRALNTQLNHPIRGTRREIKKSHPLLKIKGCHANNLKEIDVEIPLARLTVLTGISGSGKSTLMHQGIAPAASGKLRNKSKSFKSVSGVNHIKSVYEVDQSPIGKTSRSCPATYVKVFDHIRALFAQLPEARMRGFEASRFSFNTADGRCEECKGNGRVKLQMDFLPSTWVHCESCDGMRYNSATLEVLFKGKNIGQVLAMTIDEAAEFFESQPRISHPLKLMSDTGLGYLQLGQPSPTLSGGEAQRIKLVSELIKGRGMKATLNNAKLKTRNLYLIEEPTVGLHLEDIKRLIDVLHRLADEGHTVVVIEHHMGVAAEADWILDIGPEAGAFGGKIVAQGTPEKVARSKQSRTAPFLKEALQL